MNKAITLFLILALCGCASPAPSVVGPDASPAPSEVGPTAADGDNSHWISRPEAGALIIYGVSGRQQRRETEIENARADAARKASMYHGVHAVFENVQNIGSGFLNYHVDSNTLLGYDEDLGKYQDRLAFDPERDVLTIDGGVFVRFSYPAAFPGTLNYSFGNDKDGRPEWTSRPPNMIGDFYAGVGFSGRQLRLRDTITKSYESAIVSIVSQISTGMVTRDAAVGHQNQSFILRQSQGNLGNFLVLEIWIDPVSLAVWTLAVARDLN